MWPPLAPRTMTITRSLTATPRPVSTRPALDAVGAIRIVIYGRVGHPPHVTHLSDPDPGALVERAYLALVDACAVPPLAIREVIENLVHAEFRDAFASVIDSGRILRIADRGPGIADPAQALEPGFSTASARLRRIIRGVGAGLPTARDLVSQDGGSLELAPNLDRGTVVTLTAAGRPAADAPSEAPAGGLARLLALVLELGDADIDALAGELEWSIARCGRELVYLEQLGLVQRDDAGRRRLTERGSQTVAELF